GVDVEVPYEFKESDSSDKRDNIHLYEGEQTLDGEEALAFARTRKKDSDFERGKRQLELVESIINKSTSVSSVLKYDDIIEAVGDNLKTNMTFMVMKSFFSYATHEKGIDVEQFTLDGYDYQPANVYYWQIDEGSLENTIAKMKAHLEIDGYTLDDLDDLENNEDENNEDNEISEEQNGTENDYYENPNGNSNEEEGLNEETDEEIYEENQTEDQSEIYNENEYDY